MRIRCCGDPHVADGDRLAAGYFDDRNTVLRMPEDLPWNAGAAFCKRLRRCNESIDQALRAGRTIDRYDSGTVDLKTHSEHCEESADMIEVHVTQKNRMNPRQRDARLGQLLGSAVTGVDKNRLIAR